MDIWANFTFDVMSQIVFISDIMLEDSSNRCETGEKQSGAPALGTNECWHTTIFHFLTQCQINTFSEIRVRYSCKLFNEMKHRWQTHINTIWCEFKGWKLRFNNIVFQLMWKIPIFC